MVSRVYIPHAFDRKDDFALIVHRLQVRKHDEALHPGSDNKLSDYLDTNVRISPLWIRRWPYSSVRTTTTIRTKTSALTNLHDIL
jgi:hypothetical protein